MRDYVSGTLYQQSVSLQKKKTPKISKKNVLYVKQHKG